MRRVLYLHGFASGPMSRKGQAFDAFLSARGFSVERLDLRLPNRNELRVSAMIELVQTRLAEGPAVLIGSSLGGLVAAHAASRQPQSVPFCVLMAPAFRFVERWHASLGEARLESWRNGDPLVVDDHAKGPPLRVDYGFYEDAATIDTALPMLTMPTLLMHGTRDDVVPIEGSCTFTDQLEDRGGAVTFVALDDDHALTESLPVMLPLVLSFLN